jgi:stage II sporulation protein D
MLLGACRSPAPIPTVPTIPVPAESAGRPAPPPRPVPTPPATPPVRAPASDPGIPRARDPGAVAIRVAVVTGGEATIGGTSTWLMLSPDGRTVLATGLPGDGRVVMRTGARLRIAPAGSSASGGTTTDGPMLVRGTRAGMLTVNGKRYRGELMIHASDSGVVVVNHLLIDDYLGGVVPLEIGPRTEAEAAAVQAQAITARSYAYVHVQSPRTPIYDVVGTVLDQVYGGADAETPIANAAIVATRGLALKYAGRVVNAPYSAVCGGSTAEAPEVWRSTGEPYLQRVSDRIPGSDRVWCDISPRYAWSRSFVPADLDAVVARYLAQYVAVPPGGPGHVRDLTIASRTASGRVGTMTVSTDRGNFVLRGNDIRFTLRTAGGEILPSTYFTVETIPRSDGAPSQLTLRGTGNGHGIGMCQWGAIGRARAGHDVRRILAAYYPGTAIGPLE